MNSIDTTPRDLKEVINGITQEIQNENIEEARDLLFSLVPDELGNCQCSCRLDG